MRSCLIFAFAVFLLFTFVIGLSRVSGNSMYPTLKNGDVVLFVRFDKDYDRGDILSVRLPNGEYYIKRVVAVAGDEVDIHDGKLYLNGEALSEAYANGNTFAAEDANVSYPLKVKEGMVFALGDNREVSKDSRNYGAFSVSQSRGTILVRSASARSNG